MRQTLGELMLCDNRYKILPALRASLLGIFHHVPVIFYICFPVMPGFVHSCRTEFSIPEFIEGLVLGFEFLLHPMAWYPCQIFHDH